MVKRDDLIGELQRSRALGLARPNGRRADGASLYPKGAIAQLGER